MVVGLDMGSFENKHSREPLVCGMQLLGRYRYRRASAAASTTEGAGTANRPEAHAASTSCRSGG
jgi:hypothetical protein